MIRTSVLKELIHKFLSNNILTKQDRKRISSFKEIHLITRLVVVEGISLSLILFKYGPIFWNYLKTLITHVRYYISLNDKTIENLFSKYFNSSSPFLYLFILPACYYNHSNNCLKSCNLLCRKFDYVNSKNALSATTSYRLDGLCRPY